MGCSHAKVSMQQMQLVSVLNSSVTNLTAGKSVVQHDKLHTVPLLCMLYEPAVDV